jgi:hypothetical protein
MKRVRLLAGGTLILLLGAGCSLGGVRADFELKNVPGTLAFESEADWASALVDGRYRLLNNVWNKRATSGRYRQKAVTSTRHCTWLISSSVTR